MPQSWRQNKEQSNPVGLLCEAVLVQASWGQRSSLLCRWLFVHISARACLCFLWSYAGHQAVYFWRDRYYAEYAGLVFWRLVLGWEQHHVCFCHHSIRWQLRVNWRPKHRYSSTLLQELGRQRWQRRNRLWTLANTKVHTGWVIYKWLVRPWKSVLWAPSKLETRSGILLQKAEVFRHGVYIDVGWLQFGNHSFIHPLVWEMWQ